MSLSSRLPPPRPSSAPPAAASRPPAPVQDGPPPGTRERRRQPRGRLSRLMTAPVPAAAVEARVRALGRPALRIGLVALPALCLAGLAWIAADAWSRRAPLLRPRHRAEALCFALATPPPFTPPMPVEPGAAIVRGRFGAATPAAIAPREAMHFDDPIVPSEPTERVGDFDVTTLWLRVPGDPSARHWLVAGWMEGTDLAVCTF